MAEKDDIRIIDDKSASMRDRMSAYIRVLQDQIITSFETLDPSKKFLRDSWIRPEGGMGTSGVISGANVLEKGGVNISIVHGTLPPAAVKQMRANHQEIPEVATGEKGLPFFAAGLSLVIHPKNPKAPTVHLNYRYFEVTKPKPVEDDEPGEILAWWFGGGSDLTPSYLYEEDAVHFHSTLKKACNKPIGLDAPNKPQIDDNLGLFGPFKKWCDEYFYITHRKESRGVGGIFFDDLSSADHPRLSPEVNAIKPSTPEEIFDFVRNCGDAFVPSYIPILEQRINEDFTEEQRRWQLIRRGRYVEFNLVYDRGTKFGLATPGARIESILMSLPETARWEYMSEMGAEGTEEGRLMEVLRTPKDWC